MNLLIILRINIGNYITVEWVGLLLCSSRKWSIIFIQQHYYDDVDGIGSQDPLREELLKSVSNHHCGYRPKGLWH